MYVTEPQGFKEQPWFHNQVLELECGPTWTPEAMLEGLLKVEQELGRQRNDRQQRFGPRIIDLDLLLFGDCVRETPRLTLPHPRMRGRAFVLVPLQDIAPDLVFPDGQSLGAALSALSFALDGNRISQK